MPQDIRVPFPISGINDSLPYQDQPELTTQAALNVRSRDPISGRLRGAQRAGTEKFVSSQIGSDFVQDLINIPYDIDLSSYTVRAAGPATEWSKVNDADDETPDISVTFGGDVYIIAGGVSLEKFNTNGERVLSRQLPITSDDEKATAVQIGSDGAIYVSTSLGDASSSTYQGRIYRYTLTQEGSDTLLLEWTYVANGRVPDIAFDGTTLYAVVNKQDESELRALTLLSTGEPEVVWTRPVPNPTAQVVVNRNGEPLISCPPNDARDDVEIPATCGVKTVDWTPKELDSDVRAWFRADRISEKSENELVTLWLDVSGNGRSFYATDQCAGLRYRENAICGMPGLRAWGERDASSNKKPGFVSGRGREGPLPFSNDPFFLTMIFKSRDPQNIGVNPHEGGHHGHVLISDGFPRLAMGQYNGGTLFSHQTGFWYDDTGEGRADERQTDGFLPDSPEITNTERVVIMTWAIDPTAGAADDDDDREGSFIRYQGATSHQYSHGNAFNADNVLRIAYRFPHEGVPANTLPDFDLCEMIVVENDFQWPSDYASPESGSSSGHAADGDEITGDFEWEGAPSSGSAVSEIEMVEGYFAHKYGVQAILDASHPYKTTAPATSGSSGSSSGVEDDSEDVQNLKSPYGIVAKFGPANGSLRWAYSDAGVGYGLAVAYDEDNDRDYVFTTGPTVTIPASGSSSGYEPDRTRRRLRDNGFTISDDAADGALSGTESWMTSAGDRTRIFADSDLNVYIPIGDGTRHLVKVATDGSIEWEYTALAATTKGIVVVPDTLSSINDENIGEPEFLYAGFSVNGQGTGTASLHKLRIVDVAVSVGAPRGIRNVAVSGGTIKVMDREAGTAITPTNGASALNSESRIVSSVTTSGEAFFIDGENLKVYNPIDNTVKAWSPKGAGSMPNGPRIIEAWRGRALLARSRNEPSNIYMSGLGDPYDWDRDPALPNAKQAISLAASAVGAVPDIVNCLIPYNDEMLIIGCDHSIWMLVGDPTAASLDPTKGEPGPGVIRQVSGDIGMAFGRPWARDPEGRVYFLSNQGGVYVMVPGQIPQELSVPIRTRLEGIDLEFYTVRMAWSTKDDGLHVFFVPIDIVSPSGASSDGASSGASSGDSDPDGGTPDGSNYPINFPPKSQSSHDPASQAASGLPILHFFWEREPRAWWVDQFSDPDQDPTSVAVFHGNDPDDRRVVMGCADGYVRMWSKTVKNDDGSMIDSFVRMGPTRPGSVTRKGRFTGLQVTLATDQDGATLYTRPGKDETAEPVADVRGTHVLTAGRNSEIHKKIKGQSVFFDLRNANLNERWALESFGCRYTDASSVR